MSTIRDYAEQSSDDYDAADNSAKCYDLAIATMREKLESEQPEFCCGVPLRITGRPPLMAMIYAVSANDSSPFIYIGSTSQDLKRRMAVHISDAANGSSLDFHRWVRDHMGGFSVTVLEVVSDAMRHMREQHWIGLHKATLLNMTDGGPGMSGRKFAGSDHAKRIGAKLKTGATFSCLQCGTEFWRKRREIEKGNNKYCSRECYSASQVGKSKEVSRLCVERGVAAAAKRRRERTHCWRGHEFSEANVYINSGGHRVCKACNAIHKATYRAKGEAHVEA